MGVDENGELSDNTGQNKEIHVYAHPGDSLAIRSKEQQKPVKASQSLKTVPSSKNEDNYRVRGFRWIL